jgi:hypothetical protein
MTIKALYPTVRPTLNLDFAKTKALDPRVTFTRASTATFVGSNGLIQTAASGAARFDHNPSTGESLGLLVEEARTNVVTYSVIDATNWTPGDGATITANAAVAPDGTLTAALIAFPGTGVPKITRSLTVGAGTVTQTVWIKAVTGTVSIRVGNPSDFGANQTIGTTWTRVSASYASGSNAFGIYCSNPVSAASFHVWGAQMELGSFPTSYIPTTTATVTRAADVASMTGTNFSSWYNQTEGTILGACRNTLSGTQTYVGFDDATSSNQLNIYSDSTTGYMTVVAAGSVVANLTLGTLSSSNKNQFCGTYKLNSYAATLNSGSVLTDTSGAVPAITQLRIGKSQGGSSLFGTIARLAYYPVRLPDAQLQALTAT